jgi:hypothetical protein
MGNAQIENRLRDRGGLKLGKNVSIVTVKWDKGFF